MLRFILRRVLEAIPVLFILTTLTFFMVRWAPGGPFSRDRNVTPEVLRNLEAHYGLDKPIFQQYLDYLRSLARGDLGPSFKYPTRSVNELIAGAFPVSLELGCYALAIALFFGMTAGMIAALRPNRWTDYLPMSLAMLGICMPTFVLGPLLILTFGIWLGWVNASG